MADVIQYPVVQALAWALVHFVWQGTVIGLAAFLALRVARPAAARYAIGVGALALMLAAPIATFVLLSNAPAGASSHQHATPPGPGPTQTQPAAPARLDDSAAAVPASTPFRVSPEMLAIAVLSWMGGVVFFSIRFLGGWVVARGLARTAVRPAADSIQRAAGDMAARLQVRRVVQVLESTAIAVPVMVGWLKPAIVLPVAALAALTPSQLEAVLAHELAHVRRHDYLVNVLQSLAEALLFYHPAVWWLSRQIRAERELCCDDLAVGVCDRLVYATALTDLAALATPGVALAATDGNLLQRIRRILGRTDDAPAVRAGLMPMLALVLAAGVAVPAAFASGPSAARVTDQAQAELQPIGPVAVAVTDQQIGVALGPAEAEQSAEQTDRQRQIEELRHKIQDLQKQLAELEQRGSANVDERKQQEIQTLLEAQQKAARAGQEQIQKLAEKLSQAGTDDQRRALEAMQKDLAKMQFETQARSDEWRKALLQFQQTAQSAAARRAYEDEKRRYENGMSTVQQLNEAEAALKRAEAAGDPQALGAIAMAEAQSRLERTRSLFQKGLVTQQQVSEAELAVKRLQTGADSQSRDLVDFEAARAKLDRSNELAQKGLLAQRDVEQAKRDVQEIEQRLVERRAVEKSGTSPGGSMQPAADQNQVVKRGDILRITIQGEPDLPSTYEVSADGTVRIPFLGAIKVIDVNAASVRTAVGKQLADRKLGSADRVTVTLMRR